jgi:hypothetical protein
MTFLQPITRINFISILFCHLFLVSKIRKKILMDMILGDFHRGLVMNSFRLEEEASTSEKTIKLP